MAFHQEAADEVGGKLLGGAGGEGLGEVLGERGGYGSGLGGGGWRLLGGKVDYAEIAYNARNRPKPK